VAPRWASTPTGRSSAARVNAGIDGAFSVFNFQSPTRPDSLVNFGQTDLPLLIEVVVVIFGIGTILHVLMLSLLRHRREFGILRSIGFLRRQIAATVAWQAITVVAVGIVVGVSIGLALGRLVWNLAASEFGVVAVVSTPNIRIALIAAGSLVASCFVVATPAAVAATSPAAPLLRSE